MDLSNPDPWETDLSPSPSQFPQIRIDPWVDSWRALGLEQWQVLYLWWQAASSVGWAPQLHHIYTNRALFSLYILKACLHFPLAVPYCPSFSMPLSWAIATIQNIQANFPSVDQKTKCTTMWHNWGTHNHKICPAKFLLLTADSITNLHEFFKIISQTAYGEPPLMAHILVTAQFSHHLNCRPKPPSSLLP